MALRLRFSGNGVVSDCVNNMTRACVNVFTHYQDNYDYNGYPDIFHDILNNVDGVEMISESIYKKIDNGKILMLEQLSNTCKTLLCLALDHNGIQFYRLAYIGYDYHYWLTDINKISNAVLYIDITLRLDIPANNEKGANPIGMICDKFDKSFESYDNYCDQVCYEDLLSEYEEDPEYFSQKYCGKNGISLEEKLKIINSWSVDYPMYPDDEIDVWVYPVDEDGKDDI